MSTSHFGLNDTPHHRNTTSVEERLFQLQRFALTGARGAVPASSYTSRPEVAAERVSASHVAKQSNTDLSVLYSNSHPQSQVLHGQRLLPLTRPVSSPQQADACLRAEQTIVLRLSDLSPTLKESIISELIVQCPPERLAFGNGPSGSMVANLTVPARVPGHSRAVQLVSMAAAEKDKQHSEKLTEGRTLIAEALKSAKSSLTNTPVVSRSGSVVKAEAFLPKRGCVDPAGPQSSSQAEISPSLTPSRSEHRVPQARGYSPTPSLPTPSSDAKQQVYQVGNMSPKVINQSRTNDRSVNESMAPSNMTAQSSARVEQIFLSKRRAEAASANTYRPSADGTPYIPVAAKAEDKLALRANSQAARGPPSPPRRADGSKATMIEVAAKNPIPLRSGSAQRSSVTRSRSGSAQRTASTTRRRTPSDGRSSSALRAKPPAAAASDASLHSLVLPDNALTLASQGPRSVAWASKQSDDIFTAIHKTVLPPLKRLEEIRSTEEKRWLAKKELARRSKVRATNSSTQPPYAPLQPPTLFTAVARLILSARCGIDKVVDETIDELQRAARRYSAICPTSAIMDYFFRVCRDADWLEQLLLFVTMRAAALPFSISEAQKVAVESSPQHHESSPSEHLSNGLATNISFSSDRSISPLRPKSIEGAGGSGSRPSEQQMVPRRYVPLSRVPAAVRAMLADSQSKPATTVISGPTNAVKIDDRLLPVSAPGSFVPQSESPFRKRQPFLYPTPDSTQLLQDDGDAKAKAAKIKTAVAEWIAEEMPYGGIAFDYAGHVDLVELVRAVVAEKLGKWASASVSAEVGHSYASSTDSHSPPPHVVTKRTDSPTITPPNPIPSTSRPPVANEPTRGNIRQSSPPSARNFKGDAATLRIVNVFDPVPEDGSYTAKDFSQERPAGVGQDRPKEVRLSPLKAVTEFSTFERPVDIRAATMVPTSSSYVQSDQRVNSWATNIHRHHSKPERNSPSRATSQEPSRPSVLAPRLALPQVQEAQPTVQSTSPPMNTARLATTTLSYHQYNRPLSPSASRSQSSAMSHNEELAGTQRPGPYGGVVGTSNARPPILGAHTPPPQTARTATEAGAPSPPPPQTPVPSYRQLLADSAAALSRLSSAFTVGQASLPSGMSQQQVDPQSMPPESSQQTRIGYYPFARYSDPVSTAAAPIRPTPSSQLPQPTAIPSYLQPQVPARSYNNIINTSTLTSNVARGSLPHQSTDGGATVGGGRSDATYVIDGAPYSPVRVGTSALERLADRLASLQPTR